MGRGRTNLIFFGCGCGCLVFGWADVILTDCVLFQVGYVHTSVINVTHSHYLGYGYVLVWVGYSPGSVWIYAMALLTVLIPR